MKCKWCTFTTNPGMPEHVALDVLRTHVRWNHREVYRKLDAQRYENNAAAYDKRRRLERENA